MWNLWIGRRPRLVVVGSVHIDTVAERNAKDHQTDVPGRVVHSIGGGAYNAAINLARHRRVSDPRVGLYTFLPKNSALSPIVLARLDTFGVSKKLVRQFDTFGGKPLSMGGFVGIRDVGTREVVVAATATTIETVTPFAYDDEREFFEASLKHCSVVLTDTNLNATTMESLITICTRLQLPLMVGIVADAKADLHLRCWSQDNDYAMCLSGRPNEIGTTLVRGGAKRDLVDEFVKQSRSDSPITLSPLEICEAARARHVIVTPQNCRFCTIFSSFDGGCSYRFEPLTELPTGTGNLTGLGDALLASFGHIYSQLKSGGVCDDNGALDLGDPLVASQISQTARAFAWEVVQSEGATPSSPISFTETDASLPWHKKIANAGQMAIKTLQDWVWLIGIIAAFFVFAFGCDIPKR